MSRFNGPGGCEAYEVDEPSDEERAASSSEDELDVLLNGTPDQKKKLIREYLTGESESSSGDEFEKEMEAELSSTLRTMEGSWAPADAATGGGSEAVGSANPQMYDSIYFDSDSEEEDNAGSSSAQRRKRRLIPSNDELLYDPEEDERDQAWVDARRRGSRNAAARRSGSQRPQALPSSDAVLNCPACMTTLCLDCQRHETYRTQYRAMFVMNCVVKTDEVLHYKHPPEKRKRRRGRRAEDGQAAAETYRPVQCSQCSTEVAVFDKDEVYHFFNILASHC
ncbi:E2F-associated phosphoprotein isoform X1 [Oryzias melastigma]|uniref:E2f-associated phosphoprotein n=1 Tax=Oryzias melastigma TaxID=30732 RepID=A0A3B3BIQ0_ORYME|nr:E2F-associated phosphoprotein isoform X1 [Oryzias melastigma]